MTSFGSIVAVILGVVLGTVPCQTSSPPCSYTTVVGCKNLYTNKANGCRDYVKINNCLGQFSDQCTGVLKSVVDLNIARNNYSKDVCKAYAVNGSCWEVEMNKCVAEFYTSRSKERYNEEICGFAKKHGDASLACLNNVATTCPHRRVTSTIATMNSFVSRDLAACQSGLYTGDKCLAADLKKCHPDVSADLPLAEYFSQRCKALDSTIKCFESTKPECTTDGQKEYYGKNLNLFVHEKEYCKLDETKSGA